MPLLKAPFLSGFVLSFLRSVTCLSVVIFLYGPSTSVGTISVMNLVNAGMSGLSFQVGLPLGQDCEAEASAYGNLTVDDLRALSRQIFLFYLKDAFVSRFWKMAMMEQYHSPEIYAVYQRIFMEESITYQTELFREMTRQGYFHSADPQVMVSDKKCTAKIRSWKSTALFAGTVAVSDSLFGGWTAGAEQQPRRAEY